MKAVGFTKAGPVDAPDALVDVELSRPGDLQDRDLLVEIRAISVNPLDAKLRRTVDPAGALKVPGYDAAGVVVAAGPKAMNFKTGDAVFYAGSVVRQGSYAEYQLVDERIVARMPESLDFAQAAALPLTTLASWELLFDRLGALQRSASDERVLLVIGGAGGTGSMAIQLARALTDLTVIATASRPETADWCRELGAMHVIDHRQPLKPQVEALGFKGVDLLMALAQTPRHQGQFVDLVQPFGSIGVLDDPDPFPLTTLKTKCITLHMHSMMARSVFQRPDMAEQGAILRKLAQLVDAGQVRTTLAKRMGPVSANALIQAHRDIEAGSVNGKIVFEGF
ncbi:zinc-binding alcohol dehydrogenase family protein [Mesorhizobium sp. M0938]|uniref:zinc-binding alcohol dehydrogenase family protein n=1 Tax=unclassified Mesorhizobium TaxID=325217 RepID=UPI00333BFE1E